MPVVHAQVTIDFELDSEPIAGSLQAVDGTSTAFNGWIQLVSLLQDAATSPPARAPDADPSANGNSRPRREG
jgi:hypothetical protein